MTQPPWKHHLAVTALVLAPVLTGGGSALAMPAGARVRGFEDAGSFGRWGTVCGDVAVCAVAEAERADGKVCGDVQR